MADARAMHARRPNRRPEVLRKATDKARKKKKVKNTVDKGQTVRAQPTRLILD